MEEVRKFARVDNGWSIIGSGGYNCVVGEVGSTVLHRIGNIKQNFVVKNMLERGDAILQIFSENTAKLGPASLVIQQPARIIPFRELQQEIRDKIQNLELFYIKVERTKKVKQKDGTEVEETYYERIPDDNLMERDINYQIVERLSGGSMVAGKHLETFASTSFMLLWFLYVAQCEYGFRHRDLKPHNIVFRDMGRQRVFTFTLDDVMSFTFETRYVPVLLDFDFASIAITNDTMRRAGGTLRYLSPEFIIQKLKGRPEGTYHDNAGFDMWALGVTLLSWIFSRELVSDHEEYDPYVENYVWTTNEMSQFGPFALDIVALFNIREVKDYTTEVITLYCQCRIMHFFGLLEPPLGPVDNTDMLNVLRIFQKTFDPEGSHEYQSMVQHFKHDDFDNDRALIGKLLPILLAINPLERISQGRVYKIIKTCFESTHEPPYTRHYSYAYEQQVMYESQLHRNDAARDKRIQKLTYMLRKLQEYPSLANQVH